MNYLELGRVSWERVITDVRHSVLNMRTEPSDFPNALYGRFYMMIASPPPALSTSESLKVPLLLLVVRGSLWVT